MGSLVILGGLLSSAAVTTSRKWNGLCSGLNLEATLLGKQHVNVVKIKTLKAVGNILIKRKAGWVYGEPKIVQRER